MPKRSTDYKSREYCAEIRKKGGKYIMYDVKRNR